MVPHGHHEIVAQLLGLAQAVLLDSVDEPLASEALDRAGALSRQAYVVDLAWLRSTPWRERLAASFDPPWLRGELRAITAVTLRHHPASTVAAMLFAGWLASRLDWEPSALIPDGDGLAGSARARRAEDGPGSIALRLQAAPELEVPGLEGLTVETASGRRLDLNRGPGGLRARSRDGRGEEREWTIPGASRGETGVLGEGIRQALLRDPTYAPALDAARALAS